MIYTEQSCQLLVRIRAHLWMDR